MMHNYTQSVRDKAQEYLTGEWAEIPSNDQIYIIGCTLDKPMRLSDKGIQFLQEDGSVKTKTWQYLENAYHTGGSI